MGAIAFAMGADAGLEELNAAQREAVLFGLADRKALPPGPPLLIVAGAGTGKTDTLAHRVAHLILKGADPGRILLLTFTRRAAAAMAKRAERICAARLGGEGTFGGRLEWAGTFHAMGARLLRDYADAVGLDPGFTILDRGDAADLLDLVRDELRLARTDRRFPKKGTCLAIYSYAVNAQSALDGLLRDAFPWCAGWAVELKQLFGAYVAAKQRQGVLDYDDLLLWWERMLRVPEVAADVGRQFDFVLVDEYQDTNAIQAAILRSLKPDGSGVTVVGDDAQAIYAFRAATVRNILEFPGQFAPPAKTVTLEQNYRSAQPILAAANAVIGQARERYRKDLFSSRRSSQLPALALVRDDLDQAAHVARHVLLNREAGLPLRDQAVLFRAASHSAALELELARRDIPYVKYGGLRFFEAAHVKDVMAILRWAENPRDRVAAFRALQLLPGIGPGSARRMLDQAGDRLQALAGVRAPAAAAELWPQLAQLLAGLGATPWAAQLGLVRRFYDPLLATLYDFAASRSADLDQLERLAATVGSRERFLTELALDPPAASGGPAGPPHRDEDYLILSTIHSAKGQEWKAVFVLNLVDGCIPSDMATDRPASIEEERRLLYVAMTRARDQLHLVQPERFYVTGQSKHGDRYVRAPRSRFLPNHILHLFDHRAAGPPDPAHANRPAPLPRIDIAGTVKAMWD
jgi:DNA helicase II / ATP-dependent DNA helicase PcrA